MGLKSGFIQEDVISSADVKHPAQIGHVCWASSDILSYFPVDASN